MDNKDKGKKKSDEIGKGGELRTTLNLTYFLRNKY